MQITRNKKQNNTTPTPMVNKAWQECLLEAEKELRMPMSNSKELVELVNQVNQLAAEKYAVRFLQWVHWGYEISMTDKENHEKFIEENNK